MSVNKVNPVPRNSHQSWNRRAITIRETDFPNHDRVTFPCHPCRVSPPANISPIIVIRSQSRGAVHISGPPPHFPLPDPDQYSPSVIPSINHDRGLARWNFFPAISLLSMIAHVGDIEHSIGIISDQAIIGCTVRMYRALLSSL